ncbi:hypothetical protein WMZ97_05680 [Lentibacillus sp. N15]|uniref:hypothetical protein n=1 Tax=Lentibacillus songyuanensis TaxID=3136161 RepID=UPI0031B9FCCE
MQENGLKRAGADLKRARTSSKRAGISPKRARADLKRAGTSPKRATAVLKRARCRGFQNESISLFQQPRLSPREVLSNVSQYTNQTY